MSSMRLAALMARKSTGGAGGIPTPDIAHWTMDSISGTTLIDELGNHNGTIAGASQTTGIIGQALSFDGTTADEVNLGSLGLVDASFSFWLYLNTTSPAQQPILSNWGGTQSSWLFDVISGGTLRFITYSGSTAYIRSKTITAGIWNHIYAYSEDSESGLSLNDDTLVTGVSVADLRSPTSTCFMGRKSDEPNNRLNALLDQTRIYSSSLSVSDRTALVNEV